MKEIEILYVEDNRDDVRLLKVAFRSIQFQPKLTIAEDGGVALELINSRLIENRELPNLILLDLNLPRIDGYEVLECLKKREELKHIPVIAFTGSTNPEDQARCKSLGADDFWTKPKDLPESFKIAEKLKSLIVSSKEN